LSFPRLRHPIVLVHGMFGFERITLGPITIASYFRGIPAALRGAGNTVHVAHVHPTAGIERRTEMLSHWLEQSLPSQSFHLIGHSSGGLDSRWLASTTEWSRKIVSITTIGSAHQGTSIADAARWRLRKLYRWLDRIGVDHRSFLDVTRSAARRLTRQAPGSLDLPCFSVAGNPSCENVSWPLRRVFEVLERWEGPNDGLVSVASAQAFGTPIEPIPIDHLAQVNWLTGTLRDEIEPRTLLLYRAILERLESVEGCDPQAHSGPTIGMQPVADRSEALDAHGARTS
jgi:triacylglycerol lipase